MATTVVPQQLKEEILARSRATSWEKARREWQLEDVYFADPPDTCLCGHKPIVEVCVLRNIATDQTANVGNICVRRFLNLPSERMFAPVRKVKASPVKALSEVVILHAHQRRWINDWERDFYLNTWRKRSLSDKQIAKRRGINLKILSRMSRA